MEEYRFVSETGEELIFQGERVAYWEDETYDEMVQGLRGRPPLTDIELFGHTWQVFELEDENFYYVITKDRAYCTTNGDKGIHNVSAEWHHFTEVDELVKLLIDESYDYDSALYCPQVQLLSDWGRYDDLSYLNRVRNWQ